MDKQGGEIAEFGRRRLCALHFERIVSRVSEQRYQRTVDLLPEFQYDFAALSTTDVA